MLYSLWGIAGKKTYKANIKKTLALAPATIEEYSWHYQDNHQDNHQDNRQDSKTTYVPVLTRHTPAKALRFDIPDKTTKNREPFARAYEHNRCLSSIRDESRHAVNLSVSELEINGEIISSELRCGVPHAFPIEDETRRALASRNRWLEIITAALVSKYRDQVLAHIQITDQYEYQQLAKSAGIQSEQAPGELADLKPIEVDITYFNLLSPDTTVAKGERFTEMFTDKVDPEKNWCDAMTEEINTFNSNPRLLLSLYDSSGEPHLVLVKPTIRMCCTPCNIFALPKVQGVFDTTFPSANAINAPYLEELFGSTDPQTSISGRIEKWLLDNPDVHPVIIHELRVRSNLVRHLFTHQMHKRLWTDLFPMLLNLIVIEDILGSTRLLTCKSGKDRTGNISRLAMPYIIQARLSRQQQIASGSLPCGPTLLPVDRFITPSDLFNAGQSLLNTGQLAIQARNTGAFGFKTGEDLLGAAGPLAFDCLLETSAPNQSVDWTGAESFLQNQFNWRSIRSTDRIQTKAIPVSQTPKSTFYS